MTPLRYYLQAGPRQLSRIRRFFSGAADSLAEVMQRQPALRQMGFNLPDGVLPEHTASDELRVAGLGDSLSVSRGGLTTTVQSQNHLSHGMEKFAEKGELWINPLAIAEFTLEFWRFYLNQVVPRVEPSSPSIWRAGMEGLGEPLPVFLPEYADHFAKHKRCPNNDFKLGWSAVDDEDPERMAFKTLVEIYAKFGLPEEAIDVSSDHRVMADHILRRGR
jgi:hypothetical protein